MGWKQGRQNYVDRRLRSSYKGRVRGEYPSFPENGVLTAQNNTVISIDFYHIIETLYIYHATYYRK
jgi:hypothetical protein